MWVYLHLQTSPIRIDFVWAHSLSMGLTENASMSFWAKKTSRNKQLIIAFSKEHFMQVQLNM